MPGKYPISDEQLNALIDNQLDADEKSSILEAINQDPELNQRVSALRQVREIVKHGYDQIQAPTHCGTTLSGHGGWVRGIAASLLLGVGMLLGWYGLGMDFSNESTVRVMYLDDDKAFQTADLNTTEAVRSNKNFLLHISSEDPARIERALDMAEQLLNAEGNNISLSIVANSGGLNLLRADVSPFAERVRDLQLQFDALTFLACRTAIDRLKQEKNIEVELLPGVETTPNALDEILTRLRQGWVYISA